MFHIRGVLGECRPTKKLQFRVSKMLFTVFLFQYINKKENAVVSCLFYPSRVIGKVQCLRGKKGKPVTASRRLQEKRRDVYPSGPSCSKGG